MTTEEEALEFLGQVFCDITDDPDAILKINTLQPTNYSKSYQKFIRKLLFCYANLFRKFLVTVVKANNINEIEEWDIYLKNCHYVMFYWDKKIHETEK